MYDLKPKQFRAATLLAAGKTGREVAEEIGVTPETVSHWRKNAEFQACVNALVKDSMADALEHLRALAPEAARGLADLIHAESDTIKLRACVAVLGLLDKHESRWGEPVGHTDPIKIRTAEVLREKSSALFPNLTP